LRRPPGAFGGRFPGLVWLSPSFAILLGIPRRPGCWAKYGAAFLIGAGVPSALGTPPAAPQPRLAERRSAP
jgi:hypothetical protein